MPTPLNPMTDALPAGIDPQRLAVLSALFPNSAAATPAAPPAAPAPAAPPDLNSVIQQQSQAGLGAFGEREKAVMDINRQLQGGPGSPGLIQQQAQSAGGLAYHPQFQHGKGAGGFLHNLGTALVTLGAATKPGMAVQDVVYAQPREEYEARAKQIEQLQGQEQKLGEGMTSASQLAYKPFQAEAAEKRAGAAMVAAQARADAVMKNFEARLDQIAAMKDIAAKRNATQVEITNLRDTMMKEVTGMRDLTQEQVAQIMASSAQSLLNTKIAEDPSIAGAIKRAFGIGGAEAPGGAQPVGGQNPLPPRAATPTKPNAAPPKRPKGVPADAQWDAKTRTWYK